MTVDSMLVQHGHSVGVHPEHEIHSSENFNSTNFWSSIYSRKQTPYYRLVINKLEARVY